VTEIDAALAAGAETAEDMIDNGLLHAAVLVLGGNRCGWPGIRKHNAQTGQAGRTGIHA
jgi:hypothetical protein